MLSILVEKITTSSIPHPFLFFHATISGFSAFCAEVAKRIVFPKLDSEMAFNKCRFFVQNLVKYSIFRLWGKFLRNGGEKSTIGARLAGWSSTVGTRGSTREAPMDRRGEERKKRRGEGGHHIESNNHHTEGWGQIQKKKESSPKVTH